MIFCDIQFIQWKAGNSFSKGDGTALTLAAHECPPVVAKEIFDLLRESYSPEERADALEIMLEAPLHRLGCVAAVQTFDLLQSIYTPAQRADALALMCHHVAFTTENFKAFKDVAYMYIYMYIAVSILL